MPSLPGYSEIRCKCLNWDLRDLRDLRDLQDFIGKGTPAACPYRHIIK